MYETFVTKKVRMDILKPTRKHQKYVQLANFM